MPTKHTRSGVDFEYSAVFVGVRSNTGLVMQVWVAADGRLSDGARDYQPQAGISAAGAVLTVFGLTKVRRFASTELLAAAYYAAQLRTEKGLSDSVNRRAHLQRAKVFRLNHALSSAPYRRLPLPGLSAARGWSSRSGDRPE